MIEAKEVIADWILERCDDKHSEIVYLLDKAYPEGSQERFVFDWGEIIGYSFRVGQKQKELREEDV